MEKNITTKITDFAAWLISTVMSPLLVPTYAIIIALWESILAIVPLSTKIHVLLTVFLITSVLPAAFIFLLLRLKKVSDMSLSNKRERLLPFIVGLLCYIGLTYALYLYHSPGWLIMFSVGGAAALIASMLINLRWKISAHGAAMGGLVAFIYMLIFKQLTFHNLTTLLYIAIVLTGLVGMSRVMRERHTPMQVLAGILNGALCVALAMWLSF
ncbi:MAG: phosphatase PAP2 family protein [Muribaculaceae bacterium]|nr:phosphatase PAP2 family protein [Muribaculaceae bacterium]